MDFKHEYQSEMQRLSPDEEQLERIRNGVKNRLAKPPKAKKKPVYLKIAAISGGSLCAAAAALFILIGRVNIKAPDMATDSMIGGMAPSGDGCMWSVTSTNGIGSAAPNKSNKSDDGIPPSENFDPSDSVQGFITNISSSKDFFYEGSSGSDELGQMTESHQPGSAPAYNVELNTGSGSSQSRPFLTFSEDKSQCEVVLNGERYTYLESKNVDEPNCTDASTSSDMSADLNAADSNLDIALFVQFDEDYMTIFTENGKFYKFYTRI